MDVGGGEIEVPVVVDGTDLGLEPGVVLFGAGRHGGEGESRKRKAGRFPGGI
jgi:hypothetical protein